MLIALSTALLTTTHSMNNTATTGWIWAGLVGSTGVTILAIFGTFAIRASWLMSRGLTLSTSG
jgi:hypothetical protein